MLTDVIIVFVLIKNTRYVHKFGRLSGKGRLIFKIFIAVEVFWIFRIIFRNMIVPYIYLFKPMNYFATHPILNVANLVSNYLNDFLMFSFSVMYLYLF